MSIYEGKIRIDGNPPAGGVAGWVVGAGLLGAGLLMRDRSTATRLLLAGAGAAAIAWSASESDGHSDSATYPPLDIPKPVAGEVWVVDSGPLYGVMPLRMTVVRLPDGGLLLHSPTRLTPALQAAIDRLGPVRALVAPNVAHWMFVPDWQRSYPEAVTWAALGLRQRGNVRKSGMVIDHDLTETPPPEWGGAFDLVSVPGGLGFTEVALFHRPSGTLLLTDLVLNLELSRLPRLVRPFARLVGMTAPHGRAPVYLRAVVKAGGVRAQQAARRLVRLRPNLVIFGHGKPFEQDAAAELERSLGWLLD